MNHKTVLRLFALVLVFALLGSAYAQDRVQILYWDQVYGNDAQQAAAHQIIANFEEANPDIEIVLETYNTIVMRDIAKTSIEAGEGPDIIYYDAGPAYAGLLANAGLLLPLDAAYEANNWDERLIPISRDWTTFGGHVYGVGHELEAQGLYWNKTLFAAEGLEPPTTFDELIELCGIFRERGYEAPMAGGFGDPFAFPYAHNWYNILANYVPAETVAAAISGEHPWTDPEIVASLDIIKDQVQGSGCFHDDAYALGFLDGNNMHYTGEAPMMLMSTWAMGFFTDEVTDEFGFMILPPIEDRPQGMIHLMGSAWFIAADTEHPEETIRFLDYLASPETIQLWLDGGTLPAQAGVDYSPYEMRPVYRDFTNLVATWDGPVAYHLDVLTPANFNEAMWEIFAELIGDRMTTQEVAERMEAEMQKAVEEGRHVDITG
ncbi:MAG: extracellular solute-binding protein [Chloroflexi bacterium]|nr:extracellular solute-binding protein [Chloroflexota bacterium]